MRTDTAMLIPEIQGESKETIQNLIKIGQAQTDMKLIEAQKERAERSLRTVSDEYDIVLANCDRLGYTSKHIGALTHEQINELFLREDGTEIQYNIPAKNENQLMESKRDFVSMIFTNREGLNKIDEALKELQNTYAEYDQEVRDTYRNINGDTTSYARETMLKQLEQLDPESDQARGIKHVLAALDDALDLNGLYETYKNLDSRNTIQDFLRRSENISGAFVRNTKKNGLAIDFSRYDYLEVLFLDKKYQKYRNLFIFLIVKKYAKKKEWTRADAIFLTQLIVNIQVLLYDHKYLKTELNETQQASRDRLIAGISRVMDLFCDEEQEEEVDATE